MGRWNDTGCHFHILHQSHHPPVDMKIHAHLYRHELMVVLSGCSTFFTDSGNATAEGSFAVFYPMNLTHAQHNDPGVPYEKYSILFPESMLFAEAASSKLLGHFCVIPLKPAYRTKLTEYSRMLCDGFVRPQPPQSEFEQKCLLSVLIHELSLLAEGGELYPVRANPPHIEDHELVQAICRWLEANAKYAYSLAEIAAQFSISVSKLTRIFRSQTGTTVQRYLLTVRIDHACSLLREGMPIKEVAAMCGFRRSNYFSTTFTKLKGCTPAAYRNRLYKK